uniref:Uncharacterized protein n=1 Tax=Oryza barthii TaxID=65489 RepID=A0A0D3FMR9_9ORYZ
MAKAQPPPAREPLLPSSASPPPYLDARAGADADADSYVLLVPVRLRRLRRGLDGISVVEDAIYLLEDLARGSVPFDTVAEVEGHVHLFFLSIPVKEGCDTMIGIFFVPNKGLISDHLSSSSRFTFHLEANVPYCGQCNTNSDSMRKADFLST